MIKLILYSIMLGLLVACGDAEFATPTNQALQCTTDESNGRIYVTCPNGVNYSFTAPTPGLNGLDGADGVSGQDGLNAEGITVLDPCGDFANAVDEVLLVFPDNTVIAWYMNIGMVVLSQNVQYQTTDAQQCKFRIAENGEILW